MEEKKGLFKLGYVNLKRNEKGQNCISILSLIMGREIQLDEINSFVESDDFKLEFIDKNGNVTTEDASIGFRFKLPWQDAKESEIYGYFKKIDSGFAGVKWVTGLRNYGYINHICWEKLKALCGNDITESTIGKYITSSIDYYNGAGHTKFRDGTAVTSETGKFIKFNTSLSVNGEALVGWFTKNKQGRFEGISWGTEIDFKAAQDLREQFYVGRMVFDSIENAISFWKNLREKSSQSLGSTNVRKMILLKTQY